MAVLETARLILRPFGEEDVDPLAELMANRDFMRFSLGAFSREQTAAFLKKNPKPSTAEIRNALQNNLCRCGTHLRIIRAVKRASEA